MNHLPPHRYVLSAGRTGTVYLSKLINEKLQRAHAIHEPTDTRYLMMLANFRNSTGVGNSLLAGLFERGRAARENKFGPCYVEINPFLCAFTDVLPKAAKQLRVVHVVRDPADWARSIHGFKASTRFRNLIDYVPFAKPYPVPHPEGWRDLNEYEKALWRWNWCNGKIASLKEVCLSYAIVRYEDMFSDEKTVRDRQLSEISRVLDLPGELSASEKDIRSRENAFSAHDTAIDWEAARRICGETARAYGYEY